MRTRKTSLSRRGLLQASAAIGGGLAVGFWLPSSARAAPPASFAPNAWIRVFSDDRVQFVLDRAEMGQGVRTSHAMLVAEELMVAPEKIECIFAEASRAYDNPTQGFDVTGASTSVKNSWEPLRRAAATAREMLIAAASRKWKVSASDCCAEEGAVLHRPTGRSLRYGEVAQSAIYSDVPSVTLRTKDFRVIGTPVDRLDAAAKVNGSAQFGIDAKVPGMRVAVVVRCPVFGGKLRSFKDAAARALSGVEAVVEIPSGVAVVASRYWQAQRAARLLEIEWDEGPFAAEDSASMFRSYRQALKDTPGKRVRNEGELEKGFAAAKQVLEAEYTAPFVAHATMEPLNATALVRDGRCDVWAGTQGVGGAMETARLLTGFPKERIAIHQYFAGGGFGRRGLVDYIEEAIRISMVLKIPVKVIWSRTDDLQHDFYRPMAVNTVRAGLDEKGKITAWHYRTATQSILHSVAPNSALGAMPSFISQPMKKWMTDRVGSLVESAILDPTTTEGADSVPYDLPNLAVDLVQQHNPVPAGFWRSVGHSHHVFAVESFIDELAHAADKDPFEFRRAMLSGKPRHRGVLELAAKQAGWGSPLPAGIFRGIAQNFSFDSYAAAVAEVSVEGAQIKVHRVVIAIDCGLAVNPHIIRSQMESCTIFGLSMALKHEITLKRGRVVQTNFHDFELLRMHEAPTIEVHIVPSEESPTGVGEPGVPVIAPAVANAVFLATGERLRSMPLRLG